LLKEKILAKRLLKIIFDDQKDGGKNGYTIYSDDEDDFVGEEMEAEQLKEGDPKQFRDGFEDKDDYGDELTDEAGEDFETYNQGFDPIEVT